MQYYLSLSSPTLLRNPLSPPVRSPRFPRTRSTVVSVAAATTNRQQPVMGSSRTMYELLAVTETADPEEIKAAYRRQARRWHPDTCRTSEEKEFFAQEFMRAHEAYRVLSDPVLREDYNYELRNIGHKGDVFRKMRRSGGGYGDWEAQLEGLVMRSSSTTWGSRMRTAGRSSEF